MTDVTGTWDAKLQSPLGVIEIVLVFEQDGPQLSGTSTASGETVALLNPSIEDDGARLTWGVDVTKPMRVHLDFDVTITGDALAGAAKAGMLMPRGPVSGSRRA